MKVYIYYSEFDHHYDIPASDGPKPPAPPASFRRWDSDSAPNYKVRTYFIIRDSQAVKQP